MKPPKLQFFFSIAAYNKHILALSKKKIALKHWYAFKRVVVKLYDLWYVVGFIDGAIVQVDTAFVL